MSKLTQDTPLNKAIGIGLVTLIGTAIIFGSQAVSAQDITIQDIADYHGTECVDADIQTKNGTNYSININTASQTDIAEYLFGFGYKKAQAVVDYRTDNGEFNSLSDLTAVNGVGTKTAEKNRCFLHFFHCTDVSGQSTNDVSKCATDKATEK